MKSKSNTFSAWQEVTSGERNQVVFENLNKTYGAYEIRTNYDRTLLKALSSIILIVTLLIATSYLTSSLNPLVTIPDTFAVQIDPPIVDPPTILPPITPPVTPPGGPAKGNEFTTPIVAIDSVMKTDSATTLPFNTTAGTGNPKDTGSTGTGEPKVETGGPNLIDSTFTGDFLTDPPTFPGGDKALFGFLQKNIYYPETVKEIGGTGIVAVSFVLDKEGNVTEVTALKSSKYSELNQEAIRVIKKLPKWNPGKQQGHAVKARMILPIRFELKQ